ncbi:MAG: hypothetical protein IPO32_03720 [Crocinitomicaceae bacterium]|nr:hypothetical protein [Crocinitomicaceae bacterium]
MSSIHEAIKYSKGLYKLDITIMLGDKVVATEQFETLLNILATASAKYDEQKKRTLSTRVYRPCETFEFRYRCSEKF